MRRIFELGIAGGLTAAALWTVFLGVDTLIPWLSEADASSPLGSP